jgi:hypothetical protein
MMAIIQFYDCYVSNDFAFKLYSKTKNNATVCMFITIVCGSAVVISFFADTDFFRYNRNTKPGYNQKKAAFYL